MYNCMYNCNYGATERHSRQSHFPLIHSADTSHSPDQTCNVHDRPVKVTLIFHPCQAQSGCQIAATYGKKNVFKTEKLCIFCIVQFKLIKRKKFQEVFFQNKKVIMVITYMLC